MPFKKRRGSNDFAEDEDTVLSLQMLMSQYLELRSQFAETMQSIQEILDEFVTHYSS